MSELRKDPILDRWVITLNDRFFKPARDSRIDTALAAHDAECPFCAGNESKAGKIIHEIKDDNGTHIKVVPNNSPYLKVETQLKRKGMGIFDVISGTGANEVFVESPVHNSDFDTMKKAEVRAAFQAYRDRMEDLSKDSRIEYMLIYKNRGLKAGANTIHLHSQLMALPVVPKSVADEIESSANYFNYKSRCVYCDLIDNELLFKERIVDQNPHFVLITPFASQTCFEMWVLPKNHACHYHKISPDELDSLADIMKSAVHRLNKALAKPNYNYMIHTAPVKSPDMLYYHWHIEILPRVKPVAGFEWGSGFYINPTLPEEAAAFLRGL